MMIRQIDQRLRLFVGGGVGRAIVGWGEAGTGSAMPPPAPPDPAATTDAPDATAPATTGAAPTWAISGSYPPASTMTDRQVLALRGP